MFRHPARIAVILALTFLLDKGRALGADKPDPVAERIADELAAYKILEMSFERPDFGKGVRKSALERFSRSTEPIELQYARCLSITQDGDLGKLDLPKLVKVKLSLDSEVLKETLKSPKFAEVFVKSRVLAQEAADKDDIRKAYDDWEIRYNNAHTAEDAAKFLRAAAMVESVTTKEHQETRKQLRDQILKALADNPEALKKLAQAPQPSDELRKSRERVKELMEKAKKK